MDSTEESIDGRLLTKSRIIDGVHKAVDRMSPPPLWSLCADSLLEVFDEIVEDDILLTKCYSDVRSRDFDEEIIAEITTGIPSPVICKINCSSDPSCFLKDNILSNRYKQPFLVINDVGSGKSTYLHHFFKIHVKKLNLEEVIDGFIINLKYMNRYKSVPFEDIEIFIQNEIHETLTTKYPELSSPDLELGSKIFEKELIIYNSLFKNMMEKNKDKAEDYLMSKIDTYVANVKLFNRARIRYLNKEGKKICLIIDNVDQFDADAQEIIFSYSISLIHEFDTLVIMSARDYTFPFAYRHVSLSAFEPRFLHLALPDLKDLLKKRVDYLLETKFIDKIFADSPDGKIRVSSSSGTEYVFDKEKLIAEFDVIMTALLRNDKIINMLQYLSDFDMRHILKMSRVALSSGYLLYEDREQNEQVKPRHFLRAIMCGNNPHYYPSDVSSTSVINLFENEEPNYEGNQLIRLRTLQAIRFFGSYADIDDTIEFMEHLGYKKEKVKKVIQLFIEWDLVESPFYEGRDIFKDRIKTLKLTYAGNYYLEELIYNEVYLEEMKNATYTSNIYMKELKYHFNQGTNTKVRKESRIFHRLSATKSFIEYLIDEEEKEKYRVLPDFIKDYEVMYGTIKKIQKKYDDITVNILGSL